MTTFPTRRRFLTMSAATLAVCALPAAAAPVARWRGTALGAPASLTLSGLSASEATTIFRAVEAELDRLENIFSLYRPGSDLSRLNATGRLDAPAPDLLTVLATSDHLNRVTDGAFDPTVQPLVIAAMQGTPLGAAQAATGWDGVHFDADSIRLTRTGAALTLNGIAQGHVTDCIADLLKARNLTDVLVDMGEVTALGQRPDSSPWRAGIAAPSGQLVHRITLSDRALATSAPSGTLLGPNADTGHIFDPLTGTPARTATLVSVSATRAIVADGLSTALTVLDRARHDDAIRALPGARLEYLL